MLEQQEQEMSQQLKNTRQCMGSITAAREQSQAALKQITLLENRLDKCFIRFNESVTHNKQLRTQIDGLRRERLMFEALDATLQKELLKTKADMAELIQAANAMHMAKEVALAEVRWAAGLAHVVCWSEKLLQVVCGAFQFPCILQRSRALLDMGPAGLTRRAGLMPHAAGCAHQWLPYRLASGMQCNLGQSAVSS